MFNPHLNLDSHWLTTPKQASRDGYGDALLELGQSHSGVVVVAADLADSTRTEAFARAYPDRFFDVGVAEQNLMGVGGGLAAAGLVPFISSYAVFSPGRNWEQLRNTICYSHLNVKVASSHAGLSVGPDGATHQALEDIALARVLPNLTVVSPCDYEEAKQAARAAAALMGPVYLRLSREPSPQITTASTPFDLYKAEVLRFGDEITLVATGLMVAEALQAAAALNAEVINVHTIKPLDVNPIIQSLKKTHKLMVIEEHQQAGGLGSAVLEALAEAGQVSPVKLLGVADQFGQSGPAEKLLDAYGLTWQHIVAASKTF